MNIKIYTDGSCSGNPGPGSYCYKIIFDKNRQYLNKHKYKITTNNRMELLSVIEALTVLKNSIFENANITVYSDSKYVIDPINLGWLNTWAGRGFKKNSITSIANIDLWIRFYDLFLYFKNLKFVWVKGHNNNYNNEDVNKEAILLTKNQSIEGDDDVFYVREANRDESIDLL